MELRLLLVFVMYVEMSNCGMILSMIDNLIEHTNNTQILSGFLCNKKDGLLFLQHFSSKKFQVNIFPLHTLGIPYPIPPSFSTFVLDAYCSSAKHVIYLANKTNLFSNPFKWIIYHNVAIETDKLREDYFSNINVLVDSDVTICIRKTDDLFNIIKIYKRHIDGPLLLENIGTWSFDQGLIDNGYEKITYKRRRNLMKTILKSSIVLTNNDSINHLTDKRDIHIDSIAKVNYVLVEHLADTLNATLKYSLQNTWGYKDKNSMWSGMIGELTRKEADIGGTALFVTSDRVDIIDYIAMTTKTRSKFIFRQPKLSYVSNVFTLPFDDYVWASICALFVIIAFILCIVINWEWKKKKYVELLNETNEIEIRNSWSEVAFETFAAMCQQGTTTVPYSIPGRITLIFLLVSFMFLYTSYSANIVALLQSSSKNIQTLQDILKSRLDVGVDDTVFNRFYFPNATEPVRRALYLQKVAPPGQKPKFYPIEEGIKRMRNGLFAFHVETGPGYKFVTETFQEDEKCGLQEIQFLQVPDPWLAIQKNSSYKKMLKTSFVAREWYTRTGSRLNLY
ncbi:glutamate receptor ionotropic, delta-2-like isoform X2 [Zophobas morio]|uniref:glutamate receptor ionotropic, delta-2-like isoform X2 n=1 Tax=Zophobas morio TaxID=2755281 RepID=UPI00308393B9